MDGQLPDEPQPCPDPSDGEVVTRVYDPPWGRIAPVPIEGGQPEISSVFVDDGVLDTHTATVDWRDGTVAPVAVEAIGGRGRLTADHRYLEDGSFAVEICVVDDDGGGGCGELPVEVANVAPTVDAGPGAQAAATLPFVLDSVTFTDPGELDTHTAVIDWGDGAAAASFHG